MSLAADVLVRIRAGPDRSAYLVEAELSDGIHVTDGRLVLDRPALLASETAADPATYGRLLFDALFSGPLREGFERLLPDPQAGDLLRVRLVIDADAEELDGLRWERLYRERRGAWLPLATAGDSPFSRFRSSPSSEPLPIATLPIRILLAVANPTGLPGQLAAIDVEREIGVLRDALAEAAATDDVEVTILHGHGELSSGLRDGLVRDGFVIADGPTTLPELVRRSSGSHILHFVGHGGFGQPDSGGGPQSALFLESDTGAWLPASADQIVEAFSAVDAPPALVYLSACESGRVSDDATHPFVALAPRLVDAGASAAVAMQDAVPVVAARSLTRTFYDRLLSHGEVDLALNEARAVLTSAGGLDWTIPVLVSRLHAGRLLVRHELAGRVVSGDIALTPGPDHGAVADRVTDVAAPRPRSRPVLLLPRDVAGLLGREQEVADAETKLAAGTPVEFYGSPGIGKTTLLRFISNRVGAAAPDGVLFVPGAAEPLHDVLQFLFDALFEGDASMRPSDAELERLLAQPSPAIVLDDADVPRDALGRLLEVVPRGRFLVAATEQKLWGQDGTAIALPGLAADQAIQLFESGLGRDLTADERPRAESLCEALAGHPLHILQAAALAASGTWPASSAASTTASGLSERERQTLAIVAAAAAPIRIDRITALIGDGASAAAPRLDHLALIRSATGRYVLAEPLDAATCDALDLPRWRTRLLEELVRWAEQNRNSPSALLRDLDTLLGALRVDDGIDRHVLVLRLARGVESALLLAKRFDRWADVLATEDRLATATSDRAGLGWVRHQQGTRLLAVGDRDAAQTALTEALEIRTAIGDTAGAAVTRHNLELVAPLVPPRGDGQPAESTIRRLLGRLGGPLGATVGAVVLATAGAVGVWALAGQPPRVAPTLPTVTLDPVVLDFGTVEIGSRSDRVVSLVNASDVALEYTLALDPPVSDISVADPCSGIVTPGSTCQVTISFTPTADGDRSSTLSVNDNTIDAHHAVALTAQGAVPPGKAGITIDPPALDFGAVRLDTAGSQTITVSSTGDADLDISDVRLANGDHFTIATTDCGGKLAPGSSCTIDVQFAPVERTSYADTLVIGDATDPTGHSVALAGSGLVGLADLQVGLDVDGPWMQQDDGSVALPVVIVVRNEGDAEAGVFYLNGQARVVDQEASIFQLALLAVPNEAVAQGDDWRPITLRPLGPGEQITFEARLVFGPYFGGAHAAVGVVADSCAGEEIFDPVTVAQCRVAEIDETNNLSNELDLEVPLPVETLISPPPMLDSIYTWRLALPSPAPS